MGVMKAFCRVSRVGGKAARWHRRARAKACFPLLIIAALSFVPTTANATSHCVYNKTRELTVSVSSDKSSLSLAAGAHFCCKVNDALCGNTPPSGTPIWRVGSSIERRALWCGPVDERNPTISGVIALPTKDSYLLVRDSRPVATGPSASSRASATTQRAPLDVDVMSVDGRLLSTLPCQFSG